MALPTARSDAGTGNLAVPVPVEVAEPSVIWGGGADGVDVTFDDPLGAIAADSASGSAAPVVNGAAGASREGHGGGTGGVGGVGGVGVSGATIEPIEEEKGHRRAAARIPTTYQRW